MHIQDGVLSVPVLAATGAAAAGMVGIGLRKMDYEAIPRVGVMSSAFFVASLISVRVGASSAHLLLPGLMGLMLGWAAFPAVVAALFLQAMFFGFGGLTSLGANVLVMGAPALVCYYLFGPLIRRAKSQRKIFALAFAGGAAGILVAWVVYAAVLLASGKEFWAVALTMLVAHVPVMIIEGFVSGAAVAFVRKIRPSVIAAPFSGKRVTE